jgi:DNA-binding PadR family transcriptional regulator
LRSLLSSLPIWTRWHRICRRKRGGYLEYRITNKGIKWFRQWSWLMPLPKYMKEIEIWQSRHNHKKENNEDNGTGK